MVYAESETPYFLPANVKLGLGASFGWQEDSQFSLAFDLNKQLLPTTTADPINTAIPVAAAIVRSLGDAPGGFKEEWMEVSLGGGLEYLHQQQFALRAGYLYQNPKKGNYSYLSTGIGFKYQFIDIDLAYLIANQQKNPMGSSLRFTLLLNFK